MAKKVLCAKGLTPKIDQGKIRKRTWGGEKGARSQGWLRRVMTPNVRYTKANEARKENAPQAQYARWDRHSQGKARPP
jgi:hypothetical protein